MTLNTKQNLSLLPENVPLLDRDRFCLDFFHVSFPPFDTSKSFKYHKTNLAVNGENSTNKRNKKLKRQTEILNPQDLLVVYIHL